MSKKKKKDKTKLVLWCGKVYRLHKQDIREINSLYEFKKMLKKQLTKEK